MQHPNNLPLVEGTIGAAEGGSSQNTGAEHQMNIYHSIISPSVNSAFEPPASNLEGSHADGADQDIVASSGQFLPSSGEPDYLMISLIF